MKERKEGDKRLDKCLESFFCEKDKEIEWFLKKRAAEFEDLAKARTYLVCSEEQLESEDVFSNLTIYGYITIALKVLKIPQSLSNRVRKELDGFSAKRQESLIQDFPCYLIGQLAKNSNIKCNALSGGELIESAVQIINTAVQNVGGRYMLIECRDSPKLLEFYHNNHFSETARISDEKRSMVQMIRKLAV